MLALTSHGVRWCFLSDGGLNIIIHCGMFSNAPLIGTQGCINYNPILAFRKLGYIMNDRPNDLEIAELVYFEKGANPELLLEIKKAWTQIRRRTKESMGRKLALFVPPYRVGQRHS